MAFIWAWIICGILFLRTTYLPHVALRASPSDFHLPYESVRFRATDGVTLSGWKIPSGDPAVPWLILCHGWGTNRSDLLDIAAGLHQAKYNLFLFDFRGHGESHTHSGSFGWWEQRDLEGALAFLGSQPEIPDRPYGILGVSMGGSVALMVAARDERLGAVVSDSGYADLDSSLRHHVKLLYGLPDVPFGLFATSAYRVRFGAWPSQVSPEQAIQGLRKRPILVIQGSQDPRVPASEARRLYEAAGEPKELWIAETGQHLGAYVIDPAEYLAKVSGFFVSSLK